MIEISVGGLSNVLAEMYGLKEKQNRKVKSVWINGLNAIITATPVHFEDGGRLKNNWQMDVSGSRGGGERGADSGGGDSFSSVAKMPKSVLNKVITFTNNLDYAQTVEYGGYPEQPKKGTYIGTDADGAPRYQILSSGGYSRQAPRGMVRVALEDMKKELRKL